MSDPVTSAAIASASVPPYNATQETPIDPSDSRMFAQLMAGTSSPPSSSDATAGDFVKSIAASLGSGLSPSEIHASLMNTIVPGDPFGSMVNMMEVNSQVTQATMKLHLATTFATVTGNLFNSLLKNQS